MDTWEKRILIIVTGLFWLSMYTYVPILALYAQRLGASYDMVGIIIGSYGLTQLLLRLPIGIASDAWGYSRRCTELVCWAGRCWRGC